MGTTRTMRVIRIGCNVGNKPLPLLLSIVAVVALLYLWIIHSTDRAYTNGYNNAYVSISSRGRRFAFVSMSTQETSYDHISLSNKFGG